MNALQRFFRETGRDDRSVMFEEGGEQREVTYAGLLAEAEATAARLQAHGLRDRFLAVVWMEHSPACLQALMAVVLAGGIPVPLHAYSTAAETEAVVDRLEADAVLLSPPRAEQLKRETAFVLNGETGEAYHSVSSINTRSYSPPDNTAVIFMSSGSTGKPKGVMLSAENILANLHAIQAYVGLQDDDRVLLSKSLGYSSTLTGEWMLALQAGASLQLSSGFLHPLQIVRHVREHGTTFWCTVPSGVIPLLKSGKWHADDLASLRTLLIVGGGMPPDMLTELQKRMPGTRIMPSYGLTEAAPRVSYLPPDQVAVRPNSVGIPVEGVEILIVDACGCVEPFGVEGEIVVSGPNVMLGYYDEEARTANVLTSLGLRTSDIGYLDTDGYLYVTGRADNAMNVGGNTLYPEPIEHVLSAHPSVSQAAVFGIEDPVLGQRIVALVVPADGGCETETLHRHCREQLSAVQRPREIRVADTLPKTLAGKLNRPALRALAKEWNHVQHSS